MRITIQNRLLLLTAVFFTGSVQAQTVPPAWIEVFNPPAAASNLKPYYPASLGLSGSIPLALKTAQNNISNAVVALSVSVPTTGAANVDVIPSAPEDKFLGTGTFIVTDESLDYVCLLTAGHVIMNSGDAPSYVDMNAIALKYRRNDIERWGDNFSRDVDYKAINNINLKILTASYFDHLTDFALLAVPKSAFATGSVIYEAPYAFPTTFAVPSTREGELFMIHHAQKMPQRLSELTDNYNDAAKGHHFIGSPTNFPTSKLILNDNFWIISNWSNGSIYGGTSGAGVVRPTDIGGIPTIVGILTHGVKYSDIYDRSTTPASFKVQAMKDAADLDRGSWISGVYKLSNIKEIILNKCHTTEESALAGKSYTPNPVKASVDEAISTQAALLTLSTPTIAAEPTPVYNCSNNGNIKVTASLSNIIINVWSEGVVNLENGFSASAADKVTFFAGTITPNAATSASSLRSNSPISDADDNPPAKDEAENKAETLIRQSFKVYPTPTRGLLTIAPALLSKPYRIDIKDATGKTIYSEHNAATGSRNIDLAGITKSNGSYFLQIFYDGLVVPAIWKLQLLK